MSGNHNSLGTISRGDSSRRRRKRRDDTIRMILAVVLVCVLIVVVGFLGVNALKGSENNEDKNQTNSGEQIVQNGTEEQTNGETSGDNSGETLDSETLGETEVQTEEYVPETVTKEHIVWLDAGHGGTDWGSAEWVRNESGQIINKDGNPTTEDAGDGEWVTREKYDTLDLTLLIQQELESRGVTVIMTRTDDTFVHRFDRAALANESGAECFVSIHRNYMLGDREQCGIEAWLVNETTRSQIPGKEKDVDLIGYIFDELTELGDKTNGILGFFRETDPTQDISVLFRTNMSAVLLEMGYMSNDSDNEKYELYMQDYAAAIADGIVEWLRTQE